MLRTLTRSLAAVAVLALTFTAVNVTRLAVRHGVPWPTALLLDPMLALALGTCLTVDARLAELGATPPAWAVALRWFAGLAAWALNIWESVWPTSPGATGGIPENADPTGITLHSIPPALLVLVSEAVAAYRRRIRHLLHEPATGTGTADTADVPAAPGAHQVHPVRPGTSGPNGPDPAQHMHPTRPEEPPPPTADPAVVQGQVPTPDPPTGAEAEKDPLYLPAREVDRASRAATGRPAAIRTLRAELRIGQARARALRDALDLAAATDVHGTAAKAPNDTERTPT
ncbi:hypothetical protein [Yinghuangia seranimata]|uniref:hypothetical protein n=1 Tax=Yinghuangia seranimata TaxID=408067 RepID=UPI00248BE6DD|nr:hypothetical protein [Yinghuangia seranimata]MDI2130580.1 hypothetical protein [Yinghuangia seranimata]